MAVKVVFAASGAVGVNVAVAPEQVTVPAAGTVADVTVKVDAVTVEQFNADTGTFSRVSQSCEAESVVCVTAQPIYTVCGSVVRGVVLPIRTSLSA